MPDAVLRKLRRLMPCLRASSAPYSLMRASNSRCFSVCGQGMYSSLDTHCTGIGDGKIDSAGATCFSSLSESMDVLHSIALSCAFLPVCRRDLDSFLRKRAAILRRARERCKDLLDYLKLGLAAIGRGARRVGFGRSGCRRRLRAGFPRKEQALSVF